MLVLAAFPWSCNLLDITTSDLNFSIVKIIFILFSTWQFWEFDLRFMYLMCTQMYSMEDITVRETCLTEVKKCHKSIEGNFMMKIFLLFFVLINFQLPAKHFSVLPCYFMKRNDSLEKRWILKLTLNFWGDPSDTASTFLKMTSNFDAVITITDCQIW